MTSSDSPVVVAVVGATASGKTALSLDLAERLGGEIVNTDAMQVYRGMDIGTAKLPEAERRGIPHHLLDVLDVTGVGASYPHRVTYHPTCHGMRMLRLGDRPLRLLREVRGIELVELPGADECCGFGGTFAVKNAAVSGAMLEDKCQAVDGTGAEVLAAADNSCLLHIGGGLSRRDSAAKPVHYAEILAARS